MKGIYKALTCQSVPLFSWGIILSKEEKLKSMNIRDREWVGYVEAFME